MGVICFREGEDLEELSGYIRRVGFVVKLREEIIYLRNKINDR